MQSRAEQSQATFQESHGKMAQKQSFQRSAELNFVYKKHRTDEHLETDTLTRECQ